MEINVLKDILFWSFLINFGLLLFWFLIVTCFSDWIYAFHSKFFKISREHYNAINYGFIGAYKLAIYLFLLIPYISICIVTR
jgi:hypothetical protein